MRQRLELGAEYDLTRTDTLLLRTAGKLADMVRSRQSPAWQAAQRLGLPGEFAWLSPAQQQRMLGSRSTARAEATATLT